MNRSGLVFRFLNRVSLKFLSTIVMYFLHRLFAGLPRTCTHVTTPRSGVATCQQSNSDSFARVFTNPLNLPSFLLMFFVVITVPESLPGLLSFLLRPFRMSLLFAFFETSLRSSFLLLFSNFKVPICFLNICLSSFGVEWKKS